MRKILSIAKKEFVIYFTTPTAYVVIGIFTIISSYFFLRILSFYQRQALQLMQFKATGMLEMMNLNDMVIRPLYLNIDIFFLLMIPVITMKLFAEEKRMGTYELLYTLPIDTLKIVIGKYLGALSVVFVMVVIALCYPLLLTLFSSGPGGGLEWGPVWSGSAGLFLMGAAFASLGMFASSLTDSQIVAAIVAFGALLIFWVIGWASADAEGITKSILEYISVFKHMDNLTKGLLVSSDFIYYISFAIFFLFATNRVVESHRWR